jgi:hypothetical protein
VFLRRRMYFELNGFTTWTALLVIVIVSAGTPTVRAKVLLGFPQSLQEIIRIMSD